MNKPLRNMDDFFARWPITAIQAETNADLCSVIEAQLRRVADTYDIGHPRHDIAWDFALMEFMTGHAFAARANILAGRFV